MSTTTHLTSLLVRPAVTDDAAALARLAALDSADPLHGDALVAEADGVAVAARSLADGRVVADPFTPTGEARAMLAVRAAALHADDRRGARVRRLARLTPARLRPV